MKKITFNPKTMLIIFLMVTFGCFNLAASEPALKVGYCSENIAGNIGTGTAADIGAAIYITPEMAHSLKGTKLSGVRVGVIGTSKLSVFVAKTLDEAESAKQTVASFTDGWNEVALDNTYTIGDDGFYIGFFCKGTYPVGISDKYSKDGDWLSVGGEWSNNSDYFAAVCVQGLVTGDIPLGMDLELGGNILTKVSQPSMLNGKVTSKTTKPIENFEIAYTIGSGTPVSTTITMALAASEESEFSIEIPGMAEEGSYDLIATVTKINGEAVVCGSDTVKFLNRDILLPRRVVAEEGTGTWCGWCPRGIVGMSYMKEKYPDTFIGIAVHSGDVLEADSYQDFVNKYFKGFPSAVVNRVIDTDPSSSYLEDSYNSVFATSYAEGDISMTAEYTDDTHKAVTVSTKTTFADSYDAADYRIAYVVLENEVTAVQNNYFAGGAHGPMGGFESKGSSVKMNLNDVARDIYPIYTGEEGSVPTVITKGESYDHDYVLTFPTTIANINNVEIVALLINSKTTEIVNATKLPLIGLTGVNSVSTDKNVNVYAVDGKVMVSCDYSTMDVYSMNGMKVPNENLAKGVYVVKVVVNGKTIVKKIAI